MGSGARKRGRRKKEGGLHGRGNEDGGAVVCQGVVVRTAVEVLFIAARREDRCCEDEEGGGRGTHFGNREEMT